MSRKKRYHQGFYKIINKEKYRGRANKIIFRSGLELRYFRHFDTNPNILEWSSEEVVVPYISPKDGRRHRYFVDNYLKVKSSTGAIKEYLIEIKPLKFTNEPRKKKGQHQRTFQKEVLIWAVNDAKWKAAKKYCAKNGMEFLILTDNDLKLKK